MSKITRPQARAILARVAGLELRAGSVELTQHDRQELREQIAMHLAPELGLEPEHAANVVAAIRMASTETSE